MILLSNFDLFLVRLVALFLLFDCTLEQTLDAFGYDAYGERLAMSEYFGVLATNDQRRFVLFYGPHSSPSCLKILSYSYPNQYVYSVAVGSKQNASQLYFTYVAEYPNTATTPATVQVFFGFQVIPTCNGTQNPTVLINLSSRYQRVSALGMDPSGQVAFVICPTSAVYYEVDIVRASQWPIPFINPWRFSPRSIVVDSNRRAHTAGYECQDDVICFITLIAAWKDSLTGQGRFSSYKINSENGLSGSLSLSRASNTDLSVAWNLDTKLLLLGVPYKDAVFIYTYSFNSTHIVYSKFSSFTHSRLGIAFGKSVGWLNNNTLVVLAYSLPTLPWSTSQIQVHLLDDVLRANWTVPHPYSVYPNSQQRLIGTEGRSLPKALLRMISWSSNSLAVLSDDGHVLLIPQSLPGSCSSNVSNFFLPFPVYTYQRESCIPGTYRDNAIWGPCIVCPAMTKNNGTSALQCQACSNQSFCPLASIEEILDDSTTSYDQVNLYPESPELTNFEDILIHQMFNLQSQSRCLGSSPLFWACIVMGLVVLVVGIMGFLRLCPHREKHRQLIKNIFSRVDLIGEGELWIGGLLSVVIAVILTFAYVFSSSFVQRYPVEKVEAQRNWLRSCDASMINAQFRTGLQLVSIKKVDDEQTMFDMLESQPFNLTVEFINTVFNCDDLHMQQNNGGLSPSIVWTSFNCSTKSSSPTLVVSTVLSNHDIVMQYDLIGPHFIGGIRICFTAPASIKDTHSLQSLDSCQFFSTSNQTLSSSPYVTVEMTKIINHTIALSMSDQEQYTGRWLPTLTVHPLSDSLLYQQNGNYRRYLTSKTTLIIDMKETKFYVKNIQEPIIKPAEIAFQAILFTTLCIELFGLSCLIVKLTVVPIIRIIQRRFLKMKHKVEPLDENKEEGKDAISSESQQVSTISSNNPTAVDTV